LRGLISTPPRADTGRIRLPTLIAATAVAVLGAPVPASAFEHVVAPGESLSSVAATDGLSVEQLAAANGLSPEASLLSGSTLVIPSQEAAATGSEGESKEAQSSPASGEAGEAQSGEAGASERAASGGGSYVVQPGDTLSAIAERAGMSVEQLAAANGIEAEALLLSGTVLQLSGASGEGAAAGQGAEAAAFENAPPYPTEETVTPAEVGAIAEENGVSPSLADAVANQESGFNNGLTSSADARGVMQILPSTWSWIGENLVSSPLAPASATSNVTGGVLLLRSLLESSGGNTEQAIAGYYQGLPSVREEGELPETEQYVESVLAQRKLYGGE
jgi:LysM repeat protein